MQVTSRGSITLVRALTIRRVTAVGRLLKQKGPARGVRAGRSEPQSPFGLRLRDQIRV
jgi:hypothetical protein